MVYLQLMNYLFDIIDIVTQFVNNVKNVGKSTEENEDINMDMNMDVNMDVKCINECSVCLENIGQKNFSVLECGHTFHTSCILRCQNRCPLCRSSIIHDDEIQDDSPPMPVTRQPIRYTPVAEELLIRRQRPVVVRRPVDPRTIVGTIEYALDQLKHSAINTLDKHFVEEFSYKIQVKCFEKAYRILCIYKCDEVTYFKNYVRNYGNTRSNIAIIASMEQIIHQFGCLEFHKIEEITNNVNRAMSLYKLSTACDFYNLRNNATNSKYYIDYITRYNSTNDEDLIAINNTNTNTINTSTNNNIRWSEWSMRS